MNKVMKLVVICLAVVCLAGAVYAQEEAVQQLTSVSGEVVLVDAAKSEITIKQLKDEVTGTYVNATFTVASEVKVLQGDAALKISDLKVGDKVSLNYTTDASGKQTVVSIGVEPPVTATEAVPEVAPVAAPVE